MVVDFYKMDEEFWDFQKEKKLSYSRINMTAFFFWGGGGVILKGQTPHLIAIFNMTVPFFFPVNSIGSVINHFINAQLAHCTPL